jgi:predicted transcriptional regulator
MLKMTIRILTAYLRHNAVPLAELPELIKSIHNAVLSASARPAAERVPAAVRKSVQRDYLICLEDGAKLKMLKRHLRIYNMTPDQYRAKWGLPPEYPMTAPAYASRRSELARAGLGRSRKAMGTGPEASHAASARPPIALSNGVGAEAEG